MIFTVFYTLQNYMCLIFDFIQLVLMYCRNPTSPSQMTLTPVETLHTPSEQITEHNVIAAAAKTPQIMAETRC